jgi:hypothetical protein
MRLRFSIRDLLCLTALVAVALGWWLDHRALLKRNEPVVEEIADPITPEPVSFAARQKEWQSQIEDINKVPIKEMVGNSLESFRHVPTDCPFYIAHRTPDDPWDVNSLQFKIQLDGRTLLSIKGHRNSVFAIDGNVLYFVEFHPNSEGGVVTAHDFKNRKQLWSTKLQAAGFCTHFAYSNEILVRLTPDAVEIAGHETCGNYVEVLDRATGKLLANKQFERAEFPKRENYIQR